MSPPERDQLPPTNAAPFDASTRGVIIGVLVLAFTLSAVRYSYDGVFRALVGSQHDFAVYYAAGKAIRQGENPYDREVLSDIMDDPKIVCYGLYPPFLAILLIPLTYLSVASASLVWFCGSHLCLIVCVAIVPLAFPSLPRWVVWLPAAWIMMNLWPVGFSLDVGNVNVPLLLILTLAFCAHARRREWTAGALLSVAAMIKLHPVLFVPYALWTRQYKLCVAICLGCCIILGASVGVAGVPVHQSWLEGLWQFGSEGSQLAADNSVVHPANQSVAAFWARLMVPNEHTTPWWNAPEAAQWLNVGVCATLWLLTMAFCSRRPAPEHVRRLEFGAFVTLAVVASTQSWEHHYTLHFIPFCAGFLHAAERRHKHGLALLAVTYVLIGMEYEYHNKNFETGVLIPVMSVKLLAGIALLGLLVNMTRDRPNHEPRVTSHASPTLGSPIDDRTDTP